MPYVPCTQAGGPGGKIHLARCDAEGNLESNRTLCCSDRPTTGRGTVGRLLDMTPEEAVKKYGERACKKCYRDILRRMGTETVKECVNMDAVKLIEEVVGGGDVGSAVSKSLTEAQFNARLDLTGVKDTEGFFSALKDAGIETRVSDDDKEAAISKDDLKDAGPIMKKFGAKRSKSM